MLNSYELLSKYNYEIIKYVKLGELSEKNKNFFYNNSYMRDDWDVFILNKNKETGDIIYTGCTRVGHYLDTLDGELYDDITKHETFKDYVRIIDGLDDDVYAHKDNIDALMKLDVIYKSKNKYCLFNYVDYEDTNDRYDEDDYDE